MPIVVNGGTATFEEANFPDLEIRTENANLRCNGAIGRDVTIVGDAANVINASDTTFRNLNLTDVLSRVDLSKVRILDQFKALRVRKIKADLWVTSSGGAEAAVDITDCPVVTLTGMVEGAGRESLRFEDVGVLNVDMDVLSTPASDNTYDAVSLQGVCGPARLHGSIRGALDPDAGTNNPRYALAIASGCLDIGYDLEMSGYQTGAVNNLAGLEAWTHARISTETPAEDDVLVWDDTNKLYRPETGAGVGGGVDEISELIDVDLTGLANGEVLIWNSGTSMWEPGAVGGGGGQAMHEDESPVDGDGDTFPGSSLAGAWTVNKSNGADLHEVRYGAVWLGTIATSGASAFRDVELTKAVALSTGETLIACLEFFPVGDNLAHLGIGLRGSAGDVGVRLLQTAAEVSQVSFYEEIGTASELSAQTIAGPFSGRYWLGIKYTAANTFQPWASLNGFLWVPVEVPVSQTMTPTGFYVDLSSFNAAGPVLGACHFVDIVSTI